MPPHIFFLSISGVAFFSATTAILSSSPFRDRSPSAMEKSAHTTLPITHSGIVFAWRFILLILLYLPVYFKFPQIKTVLHLVRCGL
jgi:hypothetical protein